ncbi:unnamed protein product [Ectocarpus fasciculatus]
MALINCSECGQQVSDQASACPACGCPISARPAPPGSEGPADVCPFCKNELGPGATTCGSCRAKQGYYAFGAVYSRRQVMVNGVYVPIGLIAVSVLLGAMFPGPAWGGLGLLLLIALVALAKAGWAIHVGPKWWASRELA